MATSRLLLSHLRRRCSRPLSSSSSIIHLLPDCNSDSAHTNYPPPLLFSPYYSPFSRFFSVHSDDTPPERIWSDGESRIDSVTELGSGDLGLNGVVDGVINSSSGGELYWPVQALIRVLDEYHHLTGLPWWVVIASITAVIKIALLPLLNLQLQKTKEIAESLSELPPPIPPPLSGTSFKDQFSLFRKEKKEIGCPSFLWGFAYFAIQVPCFLVVMNTVRRMCLNNHPGFDCGGALWFQDLTEFPQGVWGPVFPITIAALHYINVQISFGDISLQKNNGLFGPLLKYYKLYLDLLTLPLFLIGYCIPQGSLIYWATNSSLTAIQIYGIKHPAVRAKLGLPPIKESDTSAETTSIEASDSTQTIQAENLTPQELLAISVQLSSKGHHDNALILLRLALDKDPEYVRALIVMGQTLLQKVMLREAIECLESGISKLLTMNPTKVEDVDLLILASQWAGAAYVRQGNVAAGIVHFERIANMKEPEDPRSKTHYFNGLMYLSSALYAQGRNAEAIKYLRLVIAYDPSHSHLLEYVEGYENLAADLARSRRADY